jgi:SAM-dependent methyltransferase
MILARAFPAAQIVGVELDEKLLAIGRRRAQHHGLCNVRLLLSPRPTELPPDIGDFDFIVLSAVYEHLLPAERRTLMPRLWRALRPGGILLINQTPHRYFPLELHTTGLLLINYLPSCTALRVARMFSRRVRKDETWENLLRRGIRGGTARRILVELAAEGGGPPVLLQPGRLGFRDAVDLWYAVSRSGRHPVLRALLRHTLNGVRRLFGVSLVPFLALAIKKE